MSLCGFVTREPRIQLGEWLTCIDKNPSVIAHRRERRVIANPFKRGETAVVESRPGEAILLEDGVSVGAVSPSDDFEEDGELCIWAPDDKTGDAYRVSQVVVRLLDARLEWFDEAPGPGANAAG